jgi:hypothetical protein
VEEIKGVKVKEKKGKEKEKEKRVAKGLNKCKK